MTSSGVDAAKLPARASLTDAVTAAVREMVRDGRLQPGRLYSVYQLAEALGVSRSPVREALLKMVDAGVVTFERNRGFRIAVPGAREIAEIFGVRLALEPAAVRRLAADPSPEVVASLEGVLSALRHAVGDEARFWSEDQALHELILVGAGNRRAAAIVSELRETTRLIGAGTTASARSLREIGEEHAPIVAAICQGDPERAGSLMQEHLTTTGRLLIAQAMGVPVSDPGVDRLWHDVVGEDRGR